MDSAQTRWHVLGAGSLGCLFAACLQRAGIVTELILRDRITLEKLQANGGIALTRDDNRVTVAVRAVTLATLGAPIRQLLMCTKAHQTREAIGAIKAKLAADAIVVLLQNGMGVREQLERELPQATILHALSTEGAFRTARFDVTHAGFGETVIGSTAPHRQHIARQAAQALQCELPIAYAPDIERRLWLKLAVNSVINPLTALHRCRNGELLQLNGIDQLVAALCEELTRVAQADHVIVDASPIRNEILRVMHTTAQNKSSMLQDIEAGRTTEIDFINGFIVERAHAHGISCPHHEQMLAAVRALQP